MAQLDELDELAARIRALGVRARASQEGADDDRDARDEALADGDAAGIGVRELARLSGLSPGHVTRCVSRAHARRQHS